MGIGKKIFKGSKFSGHNFLSPFLNRKTVKKLRTKLGVSSKSKWLRQAKRHLLGRGSASLASSQPVSAGTYQYQPRTLSRLTGGV